MKQAAMTIAVCTFLLAAGAAFADGRPIAAAEVVDTDAMAAGTNAAPEAVSQADMELSAAPLFAASVLDRIPVGGVSTCPNGKLIPTVCYDPAEYCACTDTGERIRCCIHFHCDPNCEPMTGC